MRKIIVVMVLVLILLSLLAVFGVNVYAYVNPSGWTCPDGYFYISEHGTVMYYFSLDPQLYVNAGSLYNDYAPFYEKYQTYSGGSWSAVQTLGNMTTVHMNSVALSSVSEIVTNLSIKAAHDSSTYYYQYIAPFATITNPVFGDYTVKPDIEATTNVANVTVKLYKFPDITPILQQIFVNQNSPIDIAGSTIDYFEGVNQVRIYDGSTLLATSEFFDYAPVPAAIGEITSPVNNTNHVMGHYPYITGTSNRDQVDIKVFFCEIMEQETLVQSFNNVAVPVSLNGNNVNYSPGHNHIRMYEVGTNNLLSTVHVNFAYPSAVITSPIDYETYSVKPNINITSNLSHLTVKLYKVTDSTFLYKTYENIDVPVVIDGSVLDYLETISSNVIDFNMIKVFDGEILLDTNIFYYCGDYVDYVNAPIVNNNPTSLVGWLDEIPNMLNSVTNSFSALAQLMGNVGIMMSSVFSFVPVSIISLLLLAFGIGVVLRILGR